VFNSLRKGAISSSIASATIGTNAQEGSVFVLLPPQSREMSRFYVMTRLAYLYGVENSLKIWERYTSLAINPPNNTIPVSHGSLIVSLVETDALFLCPSRLASQLFAKKFPTYRYWFPMRSPCTFFPSDIVNLLEAFHGSEIPYVFNQPPSRTCNRSQDQLDLSYRMVDYWTSFAKGQVPSTGRPNGVTWPTVASGQIVQLNVTDSIISDPDSNTCDFWNDIMHY
jgi:carboxylesterase type B